MTFVSKPMKPLGEYTRQDLNRVLGITEIQCPYCPATITISADLHETSKALRAHAATHKDSGHIEEVLISRAMMEIVWRRK